MVDVGAKPPSAREAVARGAITISAEARRLVRRGELRKGDPLEVARLAGIMAAKRAAEWIPLCHPISLSFVDVRIRPTSSGFAIEAVARTTGPTGVEMEALTAVQVGLLTVYDMCKAVDRGMVMGDIRVLEKKGGKSGDWSAPA